MKSENTPHTPEGKALVDFRTATGVSLQDIAAKAGVAHSALYRIVNGGQVYVGTWRKIEAALKPDLYRPAPAAGEKQPMEAA